MAFIDHFSVIEDSRKDINVKHDFLDVLFLTVSADIAAIKAAYCLLHPLHPLKAIE